MELKIRGISKEDKLRLTQIVDESKYPSLNQFMLDIVKQVITNNGLSIYDSELANLAVEIKKQQAKITQFLTEENIDNLRIMEELKIVQDLVEGWIEFDAISEVMAEGEQGNEKE
ncbi:hypothetical protein HF867_01120 [Lactobacillus salivarius]|uniref:hypothetical protein n=1 Tax=Ligilactobacillus salivarius TaxID=1624 RepID=UPI00147594CB|nr:hypothetical protein [Ligilactobacillus salivarius]NME23512.1 hypothetical protein [Ligilactobacillus salivarius]NYA68458.1 hypothetical protein [Ligilactobacillus salivarius]